MSEIRCDICRRMDSAKLWMDTNDKTAMSDTTHDEKCSDNTKVRASLSQVRPTAFSETKRKLSENSENLPLQRVQANYNDDYNSQKTWMLRKPRPNVDVVLSLKHPVYRDVMIKFYQLLGKKDDNINNENNGNPRLGVMAKEALLLFKNRSKNGDNVAEDTATSMTKVRFFKPSIRNVKNRKLVEVDEAAALKSEVFLLPQHAPVKNNFTLQLTKLCYSLFVENNGKCLLRNSFGYESTDGLV